jgi:ADP-ribose pyrophosphatase YjhB (NUDIX family)
MTLGVRVIVPNKKGSILLVRHTYVPGWHLPGGGIEKGETAKQAAIKELDEETGIRALDDLETLAVFANRRASRRDHVVLFLCQKWETAREFKPNREIAEIGFFPLDDLPLGITAPTRARLDEVFGARRFPDHW